MEDLVQPANRNHAAFSGRCVGGPCDGTDMAHYSSVAHFQALSTWNPLADWGKDPSVKTGRYVHSSVLGLSVGASAPGKTPLALHMWVSNELIGEDAVETFRLVYQHLFHAHMEWSKLQVEGNC